MALEQAEELRRALEDLGRELRGEVPYARLFGVRRKCKLRGETGK